MPQLTERPTAGILIFEKQPYWGPELKRQLADQRVLVRECRSIQDLQPAAEELAASVMVAFMDAAPTDCLNWLARQFSTGRHGPIVVIASAEFADLEWPVREAGAAAFVDDEIPGDRLARLCLRLLRKRSQGGARVVAPCGQ